MKALRNFGCNGIKKKAGEEISAEELKKIGDFKEELVKKGHIGQSSKKPEVKKEEVKPVEKAEEVKEKPAAKVKKKKQE